MNRRNYQGIIHVYRIKDVLFYLQVYCILINQVDRAMGNSSTLQIWRLPIYITAQVLTKNFQYIAFKPVSLDNSLVLQIQYTTHDYLPALGACTVIGWGWLHNEGDYLPVQDAPGPVVGWGWWHWVQSSSLVSDDWRKTQVSVWCTPVWLCWPYCKRNTQLLKQTSWGSCVADTDIIHVTILNIKTNKINTTSS